MKKMAGLLVGMLAVAALAATASAAPRQAKFGSISVTLNGPATVKHGKIASYVLVIMNTGDSGFDIVGTLYERRENAGLPKTPLATTLDVRLHGGSTGAGVGWTMRLSSNSTRAIHFVATVTAYRQYCLRASVVSFFHGGDTSKLCSRVK